MSGLSKAITVGAALCSLGGCDYGTKPEVTTTNVAEPIPSAAAANCDNLPSFVQPYPKAIILGCYNAAEITPGRENGTVSMDSQDTPEQVVAFYKHSAQAVGIPEEMNGHTMYSARDAGSPHRNLMMKMEPDSYGVKITITWGRDTG